MAERRDGGPRGGRDDSRGGNAPRDAKGRTRSGSRGARHAADGTPRGPRDGGPRGRQRSAQAPGERARRTDAARLAAYEVMRAVADGGYANLVMPKVLRDKGVRGRDAAFATELAYGAIRMRGRYDAIIAYAAQRELDAIDPNVLDTLRLGVHQLLGMRVSPHAATSETVALARQVNGAGAAGFVNAVLRRVGERTSDEWLALLTGPESATGGDRLADLAVRESHPLWIVKGLRAALIGHGSATPEDADTQLEALLASDNEPALVSLCARPGLCTVDELVDAVVGSDEAPAEDGPDRPEASTGRTGAHPSQTSPVGVVLEHGDPGAIAALRQGRAAVQDEGSQLLSLALAGAPLGPQVLGDAATDASNQTDPEVDDEAWLDLCAGPGGKAGLLAAIAVQRGIPFLANEVSEHRAQLVRQTLRAVERQPDASVTVFVGDGRELRDDLVDLPADGQGFSRVLVDAPCTGLGALRRRPEARWRREPSDVATLARLQRELLTSALDITRPGGLVGYATCSPHLNETRFVVQDVMKKRDDIELVDAREHFRDAHGEQLPDLGDGPYVQLWPHLHGTDAMFFALLRRTR